MLSQSKSTSASIRPEEYLWVPCNIQQCCLCRFVLFTVSIEWEQSVLSSSLNYNKEKKKSAAEKLAIRKPVFFSLRAQEVTAHYQHLTKSEPRIWDKLAGGNSWVPPQICKSEALLRPSNSWGLSCLSLALCPFGLWLLWSILGNVSFWGEISCWLVCNWLVSTLRTNSVHSCFWINKTLLKLVYKEFYMLFWIALGIHQKPNLLGCSNTASLIIFWTSTFYFFHAD